jgi:DNA-binding NtrC family response regulator
MMVESNSLNHVLFVDDEPGLRAAVTTILADSGFQVAAAESVTDAIKQIESNHFDAVISDLNIASGGDGYEVASAARQVNPRCVTIIFTGYPDLESAVRGIHESVDDYVIKPATFDFLPLLYALKRQLAKRKTKASILSVSYDEVLLRTRQMLLESKGYEVTSATGFAQSLQSCTAGDFDLFVLGHSIPYTDKEKLVTAFKQSCPAPVISLRRNAGERIVDGADYHIDPDPEPLLKLIAKILADKADTQQQGA